MLSLEPFPKSPELYEFGYAIPPFLSRINMVLWFWDLNRNKLYLNHPDKKTFLRYSNILSSFHKNTMKLFKIQAAVNIRSKQSPDIISENFHYPVLLKSYQIWYNFATEVHMVLCLKSGLYNYEDARKLCEGPESQQGEYILQLFGENEGLPLVVQTMEEHDKELINSIKLAMVPERVEDANKVAET